MAEVSKYVWQKYKNKINDENYSSAKLNKKEKAVRGWQHIMLKAI